MTELEDQRDFLLRSLEDLERERAAGDVDAADYVALKDDYTARAARAIRRIEAGATAPAPSTPRPRRRQALVVGAAIVLFAVVAGLLVAQAAGRRDPGDTLTGDIRQSVIERLNEASRLGAEGRLEEAVEVYDDVLADDPGNVEALAYRGWCLHLTGNTNDGVPSLVEAAQLDPEYVDAHALLAVVFSQIGLVEQAAAALDRVDQLDPPRAMLELLEPVRARVDAFFASTTTTVQVGGGT